MKKQITGVIIVPNFLHFYDVLMPACMHAPACVPTSSCVSISLAYASFNDSYYNNTQCLVPCYAYMQEGEGANHVINKTWRIDSDTP